MKRWSQVFLIVVLAFSVAACAGGQTPPPPTPTAVVAAPTEIPTRVPETIEVAMGYIPSVQFAPFYVSKVKNFYRDAGLDVKFRYGFESDLIKLVGTNEIPFMVGSGEEVILGRAQGVPVTYVMSWYRKFPIVVFAPKSAGLDKPEKLAGRKIGIPGLFGASYVGWKALAKTAGIDESTVTLETVGFTQAAAVQEKKVDAAIDYSVNGPVQLRGNGQEVDEIFVADYADLPSNGIITNEKLIAENPELVQRFVQATLRGLEYTLANPDGAFAISVQEVPEAGADDNARKTNRAIFDDVYKLWQTDGKLGVSDLSRWQTAVKIMRDTGLITTDVAPETLFTNRFVEAK